MMSGINFRYGYCRYNLCSKVPFRAINQKSKLTIFPAFSRDGTLETRGVFLSYDFSTVSETPRTSLRKHIVIAPRESLDHVPALSLVDGMNIKNYTKQGGKFLLYPVCSKCNKALSNCLELGFYDRLNLLSIKYDKKLSKFERWTPEELEEMGPNMRSAIEGGQYKIFLLQEKLSIINEKMTKIELGEMSEEGILLLV